MQTTIVIAFRSFLQVQISRVIERDHMRLLNNLSISSINRDIHPIIKALADKMLILTLLLSLMNLLHLIGNGSIIIILLPFEQHVNLLDQVHMGCLHFWVGFHGSSFIFLNLVEYRSFDTFQRVKLLQKLELGV